MSKPLSKLLSTQDKENLLSHNIHLELNSLVKHVYINSQLIELRISYKKPTPSKVSRFISDVINKLNLQEEQLFDIAETTPMGFNDAINTFSSLLKNKTDGFTNAKNKMLSMEAEHSIKKEIERLNKTNDFPEIFHHARKRKRTIVAYLGDTNSGKTYNALKEIATSQSSIYMAPLRLLALENYESLNAQSVITSLITGEEKIIYDEATCVSSTVECFNPNMEYDVAVIDEIQMIDDLERGAFFIQALVGCNAKRVVVTGPKEYAKRLTEIANYLNEDIEIHTFQRKSELKKIKKPLKLANIKPNTALVGFSKRELYSLQKQLPPHIKSTLIYGSLGSEVRKQQAKRFMDGEVDVILTTDCIGMGLNLPIENVIFSAHSKFNGTEVDEIGTMLCKQICGRAGRYGKFDTGYYGALNHKTLAYVADNANRKLIPSKGKFNVLPPEPYIRSLSEKYTISSILKTWNLKFKFKEKSIFNTTMLSNQIHIAEFLEKLYPNDYRQYWTLIYCPIDYKKQEIEFKEIVYKLINNIMIGIPQPNIHVSSQNDLELLYREATLYKWFFNHYPDHFDEDGQDDINSLIDKINNALIKRLS